MTYRGNAGSGDRSLFLHNKINRRHIYRVDGGYSCSGFYNNILAIFELLKSSWFRDMGTKRSVIQKLTILLLSCAVSGSASAADYFDLGAEELLSAEVVSASKTSGTVWNSAAAVYVISNEDIHRSGARNIPDALRMVPGVQVAQADANSWAISIRGFNGTLANKLLVMVDGRTIYNPLFAGTYWELQDMVLGDIERIEVVRGPGGTLWGANAVNGVINIITKKAADTQGNRVSVSAGNYDRGTASARHGGRFDDGYYRVYAKRMSLGSFETPSGDDAYDDADGYRVGFRTDWNTGLTLQGDAYSVDDKQISSLPILVAPYADIEKESMRSRGASLHARGKRDLNNGGALSFQSYIDYRQREQLILEDKRLIFDSEVQYDFPSYGRHQAIIGAGYRVTTDWLGNSPYVIFSPSDRVQDIFKFFAQDKYELVPEKWYFTLGTKIEHNDYTGIEVQPNARLQWFPSRSQTVWAAVSRAVRTPSRLERDVDINSTVFPPGVFLNPAFPTLLQLQASADLESEDLIAYEVGYRQQVTPDFSIDTTAFLNDYRNLVSFGFPPPSLVNNGVDPIYNLFPAQVNNAMTGEVYGLEIAASWKVRDNWTLSGSYTLMDMYLHTPSNGAITDLESAEGQAPHQQANIRSSWNINHDWSLDTAVYYTGKMTRPSVDSYVRVDANVGYRINDNTQFNLIGQNLIDSGHREFNGAGAYNAVEIPTVVIGKVTWNF